METKPMSDAELAKKKREIRNSFTEEEENNIRDIFEKIRNNNSKKVEIIKRSLNREIVIGDKYRIVFDEDLESINITRIDKKLTIKHTILTEILVEEFNELFDELQYIEELKDRKKEGEKELSNFMEYLEK